MLLKQIFVTLVLFFTLSCGHLKKAVLPGGVRLSWETPANVVALIAPAWTQDAGARP